MAKNQTKYSADYNRKTYDSIICRVRIGGADRIRQHIAGRDRSVNAFMLRALRQALEDDGADAETIAAICGDGHGIASK